MPRPAHAHATVGPRNDMPQEIKSELERELSDLKREVIEGRNLVIKTDNLLKNLHAELKMVGKRQEDFQKRQWISSAVAYALFAILAGVGAVLLSSAKMAGVEQEKESYRKQVGELSTQVSKLQTDVESNDAAARQATEAYRMMTTLPGDERLKGVDAYAKIDTARLSPLERQALIDRAELLRKEIGQAAFERGKLAFRRNEMPGVVEELTRFLAMNPSQEDVIDASFFLGVAYNHLRQHEKAVETLSQYVHSDKRGKSRDYAMNLLAHSYEMTGQMDKAVQVARDALATYPNSQFAGQLRLRVSTLRRAQGEAAAGGAAQ